MAPMKQDRVPIGLECSHIYNSRKEFPPYLCMLLLVEVVNLHILLLTKQKRNV
jgi:hypothetical protein